MFSYSQAFSRILKYSREPWSVIECSRCRVFSSILVFLSIRRYSRILSSILECSRSRVFSSILRCSRSRAPKSFLSAPVQCFRPLRPSGPSGCPERARSVFPSAHVAPGAPVQCSPSAHLPPERACAVFLRLLIAPVQRFRAPKWLLSAPLQCF